jgi:hypothetical protein
LVLLLIQDMVLLLIQDLAFAFDFARIRAGLQPSRNPQVHGGFSR